MRLRDPVSRPEGIKHKVTVDVIKVLANIYVCRYEEAAVLESQTLQICQETLGFKHIRTIDAMRALAKSLWFMGWYQEAEFYQRQVVLLRQEALGRKHPHTIKGMSNFSNSFRLLGRYDKARTMQIQILKMTQGIRGLILKREEQWET